MFHDSPVVGLNRIPWYESPTATIRSSYPLAGAGFSSSARPLPLIKPTRAITATLVRMALSLRFGANEDRSGPAVSLDGLLSERQQRSEIARGRPKVAILCAPPEPDQTPLRAYPRRPTA